MKNHKLTVVVTGSSGFIGKHLCEALEKHPDVKKLIKFDKADRLQWNVCGSYDVEQHIGNHEPDIIFHLAANTTIKYDYTSGKQAMDNIEGTHLILQNIPKHCRFVLASSVHCAYCTSLYAASKLASEALVTAYVRMGLREGVILRFTSVVGKNMTHGVVHDFMTKLQSDNPTLDIIGEFPGSIRPYIHISDVVRALIYFGIESNDDFIPPVNISTNSLLNIDQVANIIMNTMDITKPKNWLGAKSKWLGDVELLGQSSCYQNSTYNWKPETQSKEAIIQAVKDNL
jgi:UDP-glucose 4-epimerase